MNENQHVWKDIPVDENQYINHDGTYRSRCRKCDDPIIIVSDGVHLFTQCTTCNYDLAWRGNEYHYFFTDPPHSIIYTISTDGTVNFNGRNGHA